MVLNVKKTKEIIFDFRVKKSINLCDLEIERAGWLVEQIDKERGKFRKMMTQLK